MSAMTHKGYAARVEYDAEDRIFIGRLAGIDDIVTFHGATVDELEAAFQDAVDHYLEVSDRIGRRAQKPYSGNLMLRIPPDTHARVAVAAEVAGKSINQWAADVLGRAAGR
ncbi:MAG: type II toxin-antitoxin system HicB family antitoxin [Alphaproteobacteria bacterium]